MAIDKTHEGLVDVDEDSLCSYYYLGRMDWYQIFILSKKSAGSIFSTAYQTTELTRLVGCLWLAITVLSAAGLFRSLTFSPVLVLQLIYKSCWLIIEVFPAMNSGSPSPKSIAFFFHVWVIVLSFVILCQFLFNN